MAQGLVMFDWDGVIVDSLDMFTTDFLAACHEKGFTQPQSQADVLALFDDNVYKAIENHGLDKAAINNILKSYEEKSRDTVDNLHLFEGMPEALNQIAEDNKVFIITSNVSAVPKRVLHLHGVTCIEDVIGAEKEKSKIKKIENLVKNYPKFNPWYIGDTKGDIIEGKESGARTVGVAWGWHGADKLKESAPDFIAYSPQELVNILCSSY